MGRRRAAPAARSARSAPGARGTDAGPEPRLRHARGRAVAGGGPSQHTERERVFLAGWTAGIHVHAWRQRGGRGGAGAPNG